MLSAFSFLVYIHFVSLSHAVKFNIIIDKNLAKNVRHLTLQLYWTLVIPCVWLKPLHCQELSNLPCFVKLHIEWSQKESGSTGML